MPDPAGLLIKLPPVEAIRAQFPALQRRHGAAPYVYLDGPGGTQVPRQTIAAISAYLERSNANHDGAFPTSEESDRVAADAHAAGADFLGAESDEIVFGPNMTTLTFAVSRAIGRTLARGDEIVVTALDHDANVAPWLALEEERGIVVRKVGVRLDDCTLDLDGLRAVLSERTRLLACTVASNAVGTLTPVADVVRMAHEVGALVYLDAVHAAPHISLDVRTLGTDFLVCSPYKFFGPHLGMLYGRRELLETIAAHKVRPSSTLPPGKWETGTPSGEALAGLLGTFEYFDWLAGASEVTAGVDRRTRLRSVMATIREREKGLALALIAALQEIPGVAIRGITESARISERVPTVAFTLPGHPPREVAEALGRDGIATWDGDYYAWELINALGLRETGGMVRVGMVHYNTEQEIGRLAGALRRLV